MQHKYNITTNHKQSNTIMTIQYTVLKNYIKLLTCEVSEVYNVIQEYMTSHISQP